MQKGIFEVEKVENHAKSGCGYTVGVCLRETMQELDVWRAAARKQAAAMQKALAAADALALLWDRLDERTRSRLDGDLKIREKVRAVIEYYGF